MLDESLRVYARTVPASSQLYQAVAALLSPGQVVIAVDVYTLDRAPNQGRQLVGHAPHLMDLIQVARSWPSQP